MKTQMAWIKVIGFLFFVGCLNSAPLLSQQGDEAKPKGQDKTIEQKAETDGKPDEAKPKEPDKTIEAKQNPAPQDKPVEAKQDAVPSDKPVDAKQVPASPCCKSDEKSGTIVGTVDYYWAKKYPAVVYIDEMAGKKFTPPQDPAIIDQKNLVYVPRVTAILAGSTVKFCNTDKCEHNVHAICGRNKAFNDASLPNACFQVRLPFPDVVTILCNIHPEMIAYIIVCKTPYFAVTDSDGKFTIKNVPVGTWKLKVWHERLKSNQLKETYDVTVEEGKEATIKIEP